MNQENRKITCIFIIFSALLLAISLQHLGQASAPFIYNDEYGYWASAARYAGYDWSDVFNRIAYYSYGYGLVLSLLYKLSADAKIIYSMAVALNGLWLVLGFGLLFRTGIRLYPEEKKERILFASFASVCLPGNIAQANYTWPENFLFFLFCLITYLILSICKKPSICKCIILAVICIYSYTVHQRTICLVIASGITLFFLLVNKKINPRHILAFAGTVVIAFILHHFLKQDITEHVWAGGAELALNNLEGQIGKLESLFTLSGICNLLLSFFGKVFYIAVTTMCLFLFEAEKLICNSKSAFISIKKNNYSENNTVSLFLLLVLLGTLGVGAIFMIRPVGTVHVVYGRYNEHILGPVILLALLDLKYTSMKAWRCVSYIALIFILGLSVLFSIQIFETSGMAAVNSVGLAAYITSTSVNIWPVLVCSSLGFLVIHKLIQGCFTAEMAAYLVCCFVWINLGYNAYDLFQTGSWDTAAVSIAECADIIKDYESEDEKPAEFFYVISDGTDFPLRFSGNGMQYYFPDRNLKYITLEDIQMGNYDKDCIVFAPNSVVKPTEFKTIFKNAMYYVLSPIG